MTTLVRTAQAALAEWEISDQYLDDEDGGRSDPQAVYWEADRVLEFAKAEGIPLEELVPDDETRKRLIEHAGRHEAFECAEKDFHYVLGDCEDKE